MEDAARTRRDRLLSGQLGHVPSAQDFVEILLKEKQDNSLPLVESITNSLLKENIIGFSEHLLYDDHPVALEDLSPMKADWDLKREWNKKRKPLIKETQKCYKELLKIQSVNKK